MKRPLLRLIFFLLIFSLAFKTVNAQELLSVSPSPTLAPTPTTIEYTLPYPGILPGSPIYPVKVFRDRLVEFFISNPLKKGEFYLLQADKHLSAGQILVAQNSKNYSLAETTISKGENYMQMALDQVPVIKATQREDRELLNQLITALQKHQEVIKSLQKEAPKDVSERLETSRQRAIQMEKTADSLLPPKK